MQTITPEVMLLRWAETSNGGATIVLQLADVSDLEPFKCMTLAKGKQAGQRLQAVFVEIGEDEQPKVSATVLVSEAPTRTPLPIVEETGTASRAKFPKGLCGLAVQWGSDSHFCAWLSLTNPSEWSEAVADCGKRARDDELAKHVICSICEVDSRKLLDTEPDAGDVFRHRILDPYKAQLKADGLDGVDNGKPFRGLR